MILKQISFKWNITQRQFIPSPKLNLFHTGERKFNCNENYTDNWLTDCRLVSYTRWKQGINVYLFFHPSFSMIPFFIPHFPLFWGRMFLTWAQEANINGLPTFTKCCHIPKTILFVFTFSNNTSRKCTLHPSFLWVLHMVFWEYFTWYLSVHKILNSIGHSLHSSMIFQILSEIIFTWKYLKVFFCMCTDLWLRASSFSEKFRHKP